MQWWMVQDLSEALSEWMDDEFPGSVPIEQHDRNFRCDSPPSRPCQAGTLAERWLCGRRYKLPKEHGLGHVFGKFEASKRRLSIQVRSPLLPPPSLSPVGCGSASARVGGRSTA